jgi:Lon protease-like protein
MINFKKDLQTRIPLLPVHGTVLLPRTELPIPISDPDYLDMIYDCVKGNNIFGVVQPNLNDTGETLKLFQAGCAGAIIDIDEIENNQLLVTVSGLCRFDIVEEFQNNKNYREARVSFDRYFLDGVEELDFSFDRSRLINALKPYFKALNVEPNWKEINRTSDEKLIFALTMICPLDALEKQVILETVTPKEQSRLIMTMIEMASFDKHQNSSVAYH